MVPVWQVVLAGANFLASLIEAKHYNEFENCACSYEGLVVGFCSIACELGSCTGRYVEHPTTESLNESISKSSFQPYIQSPNSPNMRNPKLSCKP